MDREPVGTIYDIQGFSVQDGPGIRTTVFLKGCPLHCPWCHSPESQRFDVQLSWQWRKCVGTEVCGLCLSCCPQGAISPATPGGAHRRAPSMRPDLAARRCDARRRGRPWLRSDCDRRPSADRGRLEQVRRLRPVRRAMPRGCAFHVGHGATPSPRWSTGWFATDPSSRSRVVGSPSRVESPSPSPSSRWRS